MHTVDINCIVYIHLYTNESVPVLGGQEEGRTCRQLGVDLWVGLRKPAEATAWDIHPKPSTTSLIFVGPSNLKDAILGVKNETPTMYVLLFL